MRQVYLDHQAATPLWAEAREAMLAFLGDDFGSPSSLHRLGWGAREALAKARAQMAAFVGAALPEEIIFTSDGTEAANLAVKGTAWARQRHGKHLVIGATEHPAIFQSAEFLKGQGFTVSVVPVDGLGFVNPQDVKAALVEETVLIALHLVNHDIGAVQPIREIGRIAGERGVDFFVDAEAGAGWLPLDVVELGATLLSFSPHRFGGPRGVGVLYRNRRARLIPLLHGGDQEGGFRAGLENVAAIVGAGEAAEGVGRELEGRRAHAMRLQRQLWDGLQAALPGVRLNGPELGERRSAANLHVSIPGIEGEGLALLSDMHGIAIGAGTACVSKALRIPPTLRAIGLDAEAAQGAVTFSFGPTNTAEEIRHVLDTLPGLVAQLRAASPG